MRDGSRKRRARSRGAAKLDARFGRHGWRVAITDIDEQRQAAPRQEGWRQVLAIPCDATRRDVALLARLCRRGWYEKYVAGL